MQHGIAYLFEFLIAVLLMAILLFFLVKKIFSLFFFRKNKKKKGLNLIMNSLFFKNTRNLSLKIHF